MNSLLLLYALLSYTLLLLITHFNLYALLAPTGLASRVPKKIAGNNF